MCGRYALHADPQVVAMQFGLEAPRSLDPHYNICPGTDVLVARVDRRGTRVPGRRRWGLIPRWAAEPSIGHKLANARGESLNERPAFREAFLGGRCLVPASGYYEWQAVAGRKRPWYLRPLDAPLFGLAGISALWRGPRGEIRSVALITTAANALSERIHDRMPVIIAPEHYGTWLDPKTEPETLHRLVASYPAERMTAHEVSQRVNTPANDDPALIEPVADSAPQRDLL